jgi:hypothetical protein
MKDWADTNICPIFTKNLKSIIMQNLLRLTSTKGETILIGVESIISVEKATTTDTQGKVTECTKIYSRSAMASSYWVTESVEQIYNQYKSR